MSVFNLPQLSSFKIKNQLSEEDPRQGPFVQFNFVLTKCPILFLKVDAVTVPRLLSYKNNID